MIKNRVVKNLRLKKGLPQAELAEGLKVTSSYISQVENGKRAIPKHSIMIKWLQILDITPKYFEALVLEEANKPRIDEAIEDFKSSRFDNYNEDNEIFENKLTSLVDVEAYKQDILMDLIDVKKIYLRELETLRFNNQLVKLKNKFYTIINEAEDDLGNAYRILGPDSDIELFLDLPELVFSDVIIDLLVHKVQAFPDYEYFQESEILEREEEPYGNIYRITQEEKIDDALDGIINEVKTEAELKALFESALTAERVRDTPRENLRKTLEIFKSKYHFTLNPYIWALKKTFEVNRMPRREIRNTDEFNIIKEIVDIRLFTPNRLTGQDTESKFTMDNIRKRYSDFNQIAKGDFLNYKENTPYFKTLPPKLKIQLNKQKLRFFD